MLKAILVASAVLPMPGRPATMIKIGGLQAAHHAVEIVQAGGDAGQAPVTLLGVGRHVDGDGQRVGKALEPAFVAAGFRDRIELALGLLDLVARAARRPARHRRR